MDTRFKIQEPEQAARWAAGRKVRLVVGTFPVLQAAHADELERLRLPDAALAVAVVDAPEAPLSLRARAELVASLAAVDAVIPADGDLDTLVRMLTPVEVIRLEAGHWERLRQLIQHVRSRHAG